ARRPHHVEHTRGESEQQKYDHSPRRNPKPVVEHPADGRADQYPGDQLGREPKPAGNRRWIGGRAVARAAFGRAVGVNLVEPFAEMLQTRGERSLFGRWSFAITPFARVVGHAFDTRNHPGEIAIVPPPRGRADHTDWT